MLDNSKKYLGVLFLYKDIIFSNNIYVLKYEVIKTIVLKSE